MASVKIKDKIILEADVVYLLMKKGFPISRNVRAQWMLEHLDTVITTQSKNVKNKEAEELEIVSVSPKSRPESWSEEMSDRFAYKVTSKTTIIFLAHKYRMVFNLDLSPSLATVDIQHGEIVIDEVYTATKNFLENIIKPFTLPGCKRVFQPEIYVTIIAHTPFFTSPAQQVLVQGWLATKDNIDQLTVYVKQQLHLLEGKVALVTSVVNQQIESLRAENERLVGGLFEENVCTNKVSTTPITSPESSFVNILRYGMLALSLLPEYSCAHMIIVTDGILGNPDGPVLDFLMQQLRATTIACSFLHVGSTYHPHCGDGLVPYQDLLHFVARATLGVCMSYIPYPINQTGTEMNVYQRNFLCWLLYREPDNSNHNYDNNSNINWTLRNTLFYEQKSTQLLQKKQIEDKVTCTLSSLLCCRLREGYLIKYANIKDEMLEISFVLLWKSSVLLEYDISCPWTTKSLSASSCIQYTISIEAPYEFLHDITCLSKKPLKSHYRQGVVNRFWATLTSLTESDNMLAHFSWFPEFGWTWYSVPDTIRSGMPVFYLSAYPSPSTVQLSDAACPQFAQIYQPVVSLSSTHWSRYMHTQRLTLLLAHDRPLPRHLQLTNQSGRFQSIQSRQSFAVLSAMLKNWSTFVLVENHTYVQFIYREIDKPPVSFSLIRINSKNLVVVLNIAFAAGTEGAVRHNVVGDLLERLAKLTLPNRNTEKETPSCVIIKKSLEKILIRYERMPKDFTVVNFPDEYNKLNSGGITASLSRYLYHNRWLWHVKRPFVQSIPGVVLPRLNITAIARILSTITKMRLAEGFNFTYSASGILNMVLEVQMCGVKQNDECYPCIIQYVLFPPYVTSNTISERDSTSEEDTDEGTEVSMDDAENFGDFQIISEIWIEPQHGFTKLYSQGTAGYMNRLQYHEIPEAISRLDEDCVNALLTLEYLCLLSQLAPNEKSTEIVYGQTPHYNKYKKSNKNVRNSNSNNCNIEDSCGGIGNVEERINIRNFVFDALNILPKCQQAELLYSMFNDGNNDENLGSANKILMDNYLECIKQLHNKELLLTSAESQRFTKLLLERRKAGGLPLKENYWDLDHASDYRGFHTIIIPRSSDTPISRLDEDCVNALLTLEYLCLLSQLAPNEKSTEIVYGQTPHYNKYKKSNKNVRNSNSNNCNIEDSCGGIGNVEERINIRNFVFDALNILPKCQQAELLYSMFNDGNNDENLGSANKILMDNYLECIKQLHNKELLLTSAESQRFTKLLLERRKAGGLPLKENYWDLDHASECPRWKCFIKGITASHVIITILPASDKDARLFINKPSSNKELHPNCEEDDSVNSNEEHSKNVEKYSKDEEHLISKTDGEEYSINKNEKYSNSDEYSTVNNENSEMLNTNSSSIGELNKIDRNDNDCEEPKLFDLCNNSQIINESSRMIKVNNDSKSSTIDSSDDSKCSKRDSKTNEDSLMIPVYVYDCSLSFLIDTFVDKLKATRNKDIYQDNRFRIEGKDHGDIVELRECGGAGSKPVTPEPRSEDSDNTSNEQKSLMEHLKQLSLSHCHCFVVAVYTSLVLNEPLTYNDMESAIEQCEESLIEINITSYLRSVCKHLNKLEDEDRLSKSGTKDCDGVKQLHELVKEKFERIIGVAFRPVPAHPEFYYCAPSKTENDTELGEMQKSDSDDDLENLIFDGNINRKGNSSWPPLNTDFQTKTSQPLFLQLSCSIRLKHRSLLTTVPVKNLPTCFFEILEKLENQEAEKDDILNSKLSDLKITLDIISLNLPKEVSEKYLEDNIKNDIFEKEGKMNYLKKMNYLNSGLLLLLFLGNSSWPPLNTDFQTKTSQPLFLQLSCSIRLKHRSLLTTVPVKNLPTCFFEILEKLENQEAEKDDILNSKLSDLKITLDIISLNLPKEVSEKYLEDNIKNDIFEKEGKMNYLKKMNYLNSGQNNVINNLKEDIEWILKDETATAFLDKNIVDDEILKFVINHVFESADKFSCKFEKVPLNFVFSSEESKPKFINELKKLEICEYWLREKGNFYYLEKVRNNRERPELKGDLADSMPKQERGQDENSRHLRKIDFDDFKNECSWLVELEKRENSLPNFWLILSVENDFVNVYFHCRFLEIDSPEVLTYNQTQNTLITQIKSICRRVNQYLLLQNLHKTSKCSELLESEDYNSMEDFNWRTEARKETLSVLKSKEGTQNFTPGMFQCRVVWKFTFRLHPRLKTGPGRPGLSRGIKALHGVLNRFAVTNRSNMFVYQENNKNVFYLRLHEQISNNKSLQSNLSDDSEQLLVSRSNSVVSLSQTTLGNNNSSDTRPRVRSFSEKQSNVLNKDSEDSIVLMVHGISEAGPEVKHDLVQVLQNRLDDAVLEVLSVMLARNPMCKLTPADVCFVQPPTQPESIIELTIGEHCLPYISALEFYLKQNILQFLYIPKYTDRIECRFRDHSELDNENIFLYNQSHSSGNKGIAVIALSAVSNRVTDCGSTTADQSAENSALKMNDSVMGLNSSVPGDTIYKQSSCFLDMDLEDFEKIVSTSISEKSVKNSDSSIKFKIWKQGKVNLESLSGKLILAVKHSVWDLVTEYKFLAAPFSEKINHHVEEDKIKGSKESTDESEEKVVGNEKGIKNEQSSVREKKKLMRNEERSAKHEKKFLKTSGSKKGEEKHGKDEENCNRKEEEQSTKNKDIKNEEKQNASKAESMEAEGGEKLSDIYCSTLPKWFRFALDIGVPSVKKHEVIIDPRHAIGTIIIELENIIQSQSSNTSFKAFVLKSRQPFVEKFELDEQAMVSKSTERKKESKKKAEVPTYIPWDYKKDMQGVFTKCILIARNFEQRKPSFSNTNETESLVPKDQKLLQKFNPLILDSNFVKEGFLSRQGILIAEVQSDKVTLYMYHWSKEKSEKIIKQTTSLGSWLSSRSSFFTNVTMQKLGIFSHRPNHKNSSHVIEIEGLTKFEKIGKDWNKGSSKGQSMNMKYSWNEVMRDVKCSDNSYHNSHYGNVDPIAKAVNELQELRNKEKKVKDDLSKLCAMWPDRNVVPNIPISTAALTAFKQYSRIIHFCHTPLLFLPSWRLQSAATRDHSLTTAAEQSTLNNCHQEKHKGQDEPNEKWHRELCESMLKEYREYLHFLGFCSVDVEMKNSEGQAQQQSYYLKKLMLGGVLLFEIQLSEPFFIVKLNIIECSRLQTKTTSASVNQFMLSFVDACDKIKINMHLHSFTYDFHLRCIHSYIARSGSMEQGYHLINFLDDFNKYYSKAPNYARNLIYSDTITIPNLPISGRTLYSYLLTHYNLYNMVALEMRQPSHDPEATEHVLVNLNRLPLIDSLDSQESRPESNDFEVVLIVSLLSQIEKMEIGLKYYLILTSKREVYPKRDMENYSTLGKFQTVHNVEKSKSSSKEITAENPSCQEPKPNLNDNKSQTVNCGNSTAPVPPPVPNSLFSRNLNVSKSSETSSIQIRQESINYLGYYSSHEQSMQRTIALKANEARSSIIQMINKGALQCRTHLLWNKLLDSKSTMNYGEFMELCELAKVEPLSNIDARLKTFLNQPIAWYQALMKVLQNKYQENHKIFNTPDGNVTHLLVLHPSYYQVFMMLTIDLHATRGDLYAVYRKSEELINTPYCVEDTYNLIEGFVNACCFHLWMNLCS
ncbi:KICSTOR complex protein SZT2-like [Ceratina calcarata]|uniref:KICSTOR complex protein SZT2-like n=1 Tax=Ceratina calcarata TaxID=156304 RepID=A0AAJ7WDA1_9HYME|nr:KICSTOR complex protein SZT2-like [Ceratina calcarata]